MWTSLVFRYVFLIFFKFITSEWIEITQKAIKNRNNQSLNPSTTKAISAYDNNNNTFTTPSPEWIAYQRERFANIPNLKPYELVDDDQRHLEKSMQVPVADRGELDGSQAHDLGGKDLPRNILLQAKTGIKIDNDNSEADEITSRKNDKTEAKMNFNKHFKPGEKLLSKHKNSVFKPTVRGFFKFLKSIQSDFVRKASLSIDGKIQILKNLRDKIMGAIEEQFISLWHPRIRKRNKRGIFDESNLNFPPEATLMSINFLTFAVFLIKLVLQVVHIVKSKHYTFSGFGVNSDVTKIAI